MEISNPFGSGNRIVIRAQKEFRDTAALAADCGLSYSILSTSIG
jgi:hypothetical protein